MATGDTASDPSPRPWQNEGEEGSLTFKGDAQNPGPHGRSQAATTSKNTAGTPAEMLRKSGRQQGGPPTLSPAFQEGCAELGRWRASPQVSGPGLGCFCITLQLLATQSREPSGASRPTGRRLLLVWGDYPGMDPLGSSAEQHFTGGGNEESMSPNGGPATPPASAPAQSGELVNIPVGTVSISEKSMKATVSAVLGTADQIGTFWSRWGVS